MSDTSSEYCFLPRFVAIYENDIMEGCSITELIDRQEQNIYTITKLLMISGESPAMGVPPLLYTADCLQSAVYI